MLDLEHDMQAVFAQSLSQLTQAQVRLRVGKVVVAQPVAQCVQ